MSQVLQNVFKQRAKTVILVFFSWPAGGPKQPLSSLMPQPALGDDGGHETTESFTDDVF